MNQAQEVLAENLRANRHGWKWTCHSGGSVLQRATIRGCYRTTVRDAGCYKDWGGVFCVLGFGFRAIGEGCNQGPLSRLYSILTALRL